MLTTPAFAQSEFDIMKRESLSNLEEQKNDPQALGFRLLGKLQNQWPASDPRYAQTIDEEIAGVKAVSLADVKNFYRDFYGANHGELAVVGDFDADALSKQLEARLGGWASKATFERLEDKVFNGPGGEHVVDTKDKENAVLGMGHAITLKQDDADYPAWMVLGQILGGDTGSRIWMRLRENEGLSYGAGCYTTAQQDDAVGALLCFAIVAPANLLKAKAAMLEEIKKISDGAVTDVELTRAKAGIVKQEDTNLTRDGYVAGELVDNAHYGRTMAHQAAMRAKFAAVTAADVARVAKKHMAVDRLIVISAGDMAKVNAK
jgi:zinc protease